MRYATGRALVSYVISGQLFMVANMLGVVSERPNHPLERHLGSSEHLKMGAADELE